MKGVVKKQKDGWFVESFTVSDKPPFFKESLFKIELCGSNMNYLTEGMFVDYYVDVFTTPVYVMHYAYITKIISNPN
jgi:hypothetical protein